MAATVANPITNLSRADLLRLALETEERRVEAEHQFAIAAPKVEFA